MWELDHKEGWALKNWYFWTVVLEKTLESLLDCKEIQPIHPKGNQPWIVTERTDAEAEAPILWPPEVKSWLIGKDPDAGKYWREKEKGMTEYEMVGWHHRLIGHAAAAAAKSLQSCPTLCDPIDGSPPRSPHPWDSPGKNTGVGFHFLLQCMKVKSLSLTQWPHGLQPTRLLRPWDFPGKSTGVGCHCLLHNGHEFEQTLGDGEGQGSLACCRPWDQKESDMIEWLNNKSIISYFKSIHLLKNLSLTKAEKLVSNSSKSNILRFKIHI